MTSAGRTTSAGATPRVRVAGLNKSFSGVKVLHEVGFEAHAGEVLGLVGENGSGKSTTMSILAGIITPESGTLHLDGVPYAPANRQASQRAGIAFIQQELNIFPTLSVAENLFLGRFPRLIAGLPFIAHARMCARAREPLRAVRLAIDPSTPASRLSPGERQLLEIARGISTHARVMIFDEPTTSLSGRESERLFEIIERLRDRGVAILFISHSLDDVLRLSDRVAVLRDGRVTLTARRGEFDVNRLVMAMIGRSIGGLFPARAPRSTPPAPLLSVKNVSEPGVIADMSFEVGAGEIVGVAGLMGSGRTELARILFGLDTYREGTIYVHGSLLPSGTVSAAIAAGMAFLTEDRRQEGLMLNASIADNLTLAALPLFASGRIGRIRTRELLAGITATAQQLGIKNRPIDPVRTLSGGNQQKVVLGRWLLREPSLFILDEPTRGVDIGAKEEIYRLLVDRADRGMGILVISSELEELLGLCDRILVMRQGRLRASFERARFSREALLKSAFGQELAA